MAITCPILHGDHHPKELDNLANENGLIFRNIPPSLQEAIRVFKSEFALLLHHAKRSYFPEIDQWLNNLV
jgi:hypothetical protein